MTEREVRWKWGPGASRALLATERYIDLEGGIRAQKTTALCAWIANGALEYPGMNSYLCRYTDDALTSILKPTWRAYCQKSGIAIEWKADEECDVITATGSKVFLRGLKSSDDTQRYAKLRGPTVARFGIDQAEELPSDFWPEIQGRLSQPGYPQAAMITPQPVNENHWIAKEFPEDNSNPGHLYIRTNCYDNRINLGDAYIEELERIYPVGTAKRRTLLEGRRGLAVKGQPVYAGLFYRDRHARAVTINPQLPLLEAWDYGHSHPCVVWGQIFAGRLILLGACMGEDLSIDQFAPIALECRSQWFPKIQDVWTTGDPAGLAESSQGLPVTLKQIMADHGIHITAVDGANRPELRDQAIQVISRYMGRTALDGQPAFAVHPERCVLVSADGPKFIPFLADAFEAGYVWDEKARQGLTANIRKPKKDGFYDHSMNCCEYLVQAYGPAKATERDEERLERLALKRSQRDDRDVRPARRMMSRGGY